MNGSEYIDFIDNAKLHGLLMTEPDRGRVREVIAKSMDKQPLDVEETVALIAAHDPESLEAMFEAARELKRNVYGNRIVLFAPLYIGNSCVNDCTYCGFRRSNREQVRRTLSHQDLEAQVKALLDQGHKRLILVFGEHPDYDPEFIAESVRTVYGVSQGHNSIRRVNINASPLDHVGYKTILASGIGTYQVFQETYHKPTYQQVHPHGPKSDYLYRLHALTRAQEAGIDDVGVGALFGLYDWRFEVLAMVEHSQFFMKRFHVGPHTLSFPRLRPASGARTDTDYLVSDHDFMRLVAILRLSVPYTGMIMTCREPEHIRKTVLGFGVSQIDAGSRIELGGYTEAGDATQQHLEREQFELGDIRSLEQVVKDLMVDGYIPSFCTACYRLGRTGEVFMEYAIPGFIERYCTPNAFTTLQEYLEDYAAPEVRAVGFRMIECQVEKMPDGPDKQRLLMRLHSIRTTGERDLIE